ncbi:hypothetical protein CRM22_011252 [Opisthorchis felineus]|uniref:Small ribosomal subunit protein uS13 n=1 Tax=Opisthorchis felineus TaxID=147828 RepID=A0A4V3S838_OPIFE|nr:hypothetical protein CRM22_011252 [Opisthorchis felineus]
MELMLPEKFQHILRVMNTNIDGQRKIMYAICAIKGCGRRYATVVCKKADIDLNKRAGELTEDEVEKLVTVMGNPRQYKVPVWFLNRQRDVEDGKSSQLMSGALETKLREDLERLKRIRAHRGVRHYWGCNAFFGVDRGYIAPLKAFLSLFSSSSDRTRRGLQTRMLFI